MEYIIKINPAYEKYRPAIEEIIRKGRPERSTVIYKGRNILYKTDLGGVTAVIKEFKKPNAVNAYAYTTVRKSKARRSFENASKMASLGFLTPGPIAYGEERDGLRLGRSCYISLELTGATEMRHWEDHPCAATLVPAFASEIWRLHQAGVWHKDFSPGNILYTISPDGRYEFHYVDLNRMKFGVHDPKRLMSMFRSINLNPAETARLGRLYAAASGKDAAAMEKEALRRLEGYFAERRRKALFKRLIHGRILPERNRAE